MPPSTFSKPELFLLRQWTNARLLEDSMKAARQKYAEILEKVVDNFQQKHEEFDSRQILPTRDGVNVGIGKKTWRSKPTYYISGFWLGEIRIEDLTSENEDPPDKTVWVNHPDGAIDLDEAAKKLRTAAQRILSNDEFRRADFEWGKGIAGITYPITHPRAELFELLIKDDARGFVSCMVVHLESMSKFAPVLDEIHNKSAKRARK